MRLRLLSLITLFLFASRAFADTSTSTTTLSITPSATSGTTITAADENDRSNDATTWANAHVHSLSNTTNFGDGTAGNKQLCADSANTTDSCIRWNNTDLMWQVDNPAGQFNQVIMVSGSAGLTNDALILGQGDGTVISLANGASGAVLTSNGVGAAPSWIANADFVGSTTRDTTVATGNQTVSGIGFIPSAIIFFVTESTTDETSFGFSDCTNNQTVFTTDGVAADTWQHASTNSIGDSEGVGASYDGLVSSCTSGQFIIAWTRSGAPSGTLQIKFMAFQ